MSLYKAAAFIFYKWVCIKPFNKLYLQVYLQYEYKFDQWSHFGGKREPYENDSFKTAIRELKEESPFTDNLYNWLIKNSSKFVKKYIPSSKMDVYYVHIQNYYEFQEANWFTIDFLPNNIRSHVIGQIKELNEIALINAICGLLI